MEGRIRRALVMSVLALLPSLIGASQTGRAASYGGQQQRSCIFDHAALQTSPEVCRPHAIVYPLKVRSTVQRAIYDGAITFGIPYAVMLRIARCESALNPRASDGSHLGLFQFLQDTFQSGRQTMRQMTGIVAHSVWKASDSSYVASFLFAVGKSPAWQCR